MANQEQLYILKLGSYVWNNWRKQHPDVQPDLSGADLSEADLKAYNLNGADLSEADLTRAYIRFSKP